MFVSVPFYSACLQNILSGDMWMPRLHGNDLFLTFILPSHFPDDMMGSSEDEQCSGDTDVPDMGQEHSSHLGDHELKEMLLKKYSGCLSRLRSEFLKKRKKGKLPKDARTVLLEWWNTHYRWPYPTVCRRWPFFFTKQSEPAGAL